MKSTFLLLLLLLSIFNVNAQTKKNNTTEHFDKDNIVDCGTQLPSKTVINFNESKMEELRDISKNNFDNLVVIPIKAHIVRNTDGSGGLSITDLNNAITTMNVQYAPMNMSFSLCGPIHYIDDSDLYDCDVDTEDHLLVLNNVNDAINIYFVNNLTTIGGALNGISAFPSSFASENRIIMANGATNNGTTLGHEMGHYWNLYHTHETALGVENVNGSNCSSKGDLVCDTPADPCCWLYNSTTCVYTGTVLDPNNQEYNPSLTNLMSYYQTCRNAFTAGQFSRMEEGYALRNMLRGSYYNMECRAAALPPSNLVINSVDCDVSLTWSDNASTEMGYIVEFSSSSLGPWKAVANLMANTTSCNLDLSQITMTSGNTYYFRIATANSNPSYSSAISFEYINTELCYCVPNPSNCSDSDVITSVNLRKGSTVLISQNSGCDPGSNGYTFYNSPTPSVPTLESGSTYEISLSKPLAFNAGARVWIDYNRNGMFESSEIVASFSVSNWSSTPYVSFVVPTILGSSAGDSRMRVKLNYSEIPNDDACISSAYGETEDYAITLSPGCEVIAAPLVSNVNRCGVGPITLTAFGCSGGTIEWYDLNAGGTLLGSGSSYSVTNLITQTSFYALCNTGSCQSARAELVATPNVDLVFNTNTQPANTVYRSSNTISSQANVSNNVSYITGGSITLLPGFQAGVNEVFVAKIEGCP